MLEAQLGRSEKIARAVPACPVQHNHPMGMIIAMARARPASRPRSASPAHGTRPRCVASRFSALRHLSGSSDGGESINTVHEDCQDRDHDTSRQ